LGCLRNTFTTSGESCQLLRPAVALFPLERLWNEELIEGAKKDWANLLILVAAIEHDVPMAVHDTDG